MISPQQFGKYILIDKVAVGGMAEIYKARSTGLGGFEKTLAIKRILPHFSENDEFVTMFVDEARIAGELNHANIVQIFDLGETNGDYFIAMEFVYGRDLRAVLRMAEKQEKPFSIEQAVYIIIEVLKGLDFAHRKKDKQNRDLNIIHRDISPQNILISFEGEVKLTDFGIAKATSKAGQTQAGVLKGKFAYMSPEQASGRKLDQRSDLFSVGILLYEILTQTRLFLAKTDFATLELVREAKVEPPSKFNKKIPPALDRIALKALKKLPEKRYQNALDFQEDLTRFLYASSTFSLDKLNLSSYMQELFAEQIAQDQANLKEESQILAEFQRQNEGNRLYTTESSGQSESGVASWKTPSPQIMLEQPLPESPSSEEISDILPPRPSFGNQLLQSFLLSILVTAIFFGGQFSYNYFNRNAILSIQTEPPGAQVFLNKEPKGRTPIIDLEIPSKMHYLIHIQKEGYEEKSFKIIPQRRVKMDRTIDLAKLPEFGQVHLKSTPSEAEVFWDGVSYAKKTPVVLDKIEPGKRYPLKVQYPGYQPYETVIQLEQGEKKNIQAELKPISKMNEISLASNLNVSPETDRRKPQPEKASQDYGMIDIQATPWAQVFIDNQKIGDTPVTSYRLEVGRHKIRLVHPTFNQEKTFNIRIQSGQNPPVTFNFTK